MAPRLFFAAALAAAAASGQTLVSPANNSIHARSIVNFAWNVAPAPGENFQMKVFNTVTGTLELALDFPAYVNNESYTFRSGSYRVETRVCRPLCANSNINLFTVANRTVTPPAPALPSCQVKLDEGQSRLECTWPETPEADFYFARAVQPATGPGGGALTVAGQQTSQGRVSLLVPTGRTLFLVQGCTGDACGPQSAPVEIQATLFGGPKVPVISSPLSGSSIDSGTEAPVVVFAWNRIAGDTAGGEVMYRLYVQDFSRNAAALDLYTTNNYAAAYLNPAARYDAVVIAIPRPNPFFPTPILTPVQGPPSAFIVRGRMPNAPTLVSPAFGAEPDSPHPVGRIDWTPLPDARGETGTRRYQYSVIEEGGLLAGTGVTDKTFGVIPVFTANEVPPIAPGRRYSAFVRACLNGFACAPDSDSGWGPWSGSSGAEGAHGQFSIDKTLRLGRP